MVDFIETQLAEPISDTIEAIDSLKALNIPVALLTNNWFVEEGTERPILPISSRFLGVTNVPDSLKSRFDVVVESALLGERKPEPRIYDEVLKQLGVYQNCDHFFSTSERMT